MMVIIFSVEGVLGVVEAVTGISLDLRALLSLAIDFSIELSASVVGSLLSFLYGFPVDSHILANSIVSATCTCSDQIVQSSCSS